MIPRLVPAATKVGWGRGGALYMSREETKRGCENLKARKKSAKMIEINSSLSRKRNDDLEGHCGSFIQSKISPISGAETKMLFPFLGIFFETTG
jgi:hypothetical protein